jgi:plastocyanin
LPAASAQQTGSIVGVVTLEGEPPKPQRIEITTDIATCGSAPKYEEDLLVGPNHGIANAVVSIPDAPSAAPVGQAAPGKEVQMDQRGCRYEPHVLAFQVGTTVEVINSDGTLHNVHTHSKLNRPLNLAQPSFKKVLRVKLDHPEIVHVTCDQHNWMSGWWFVAPNPYYAVSDRAGHFKISGVPPGKYQLQVWQEVLGTISKPVTVEAGRTTSVNFVVNLASRGSGERE